MTNSKVILSEYAASHLELNMRNGYAGSFTPAGFRMTNSMVILSECEESRLELDVA